MYNIASIKTYVHTLSAASNVYVSHNMACTHAYYCYSLNASISESVNGKAWNYFSATCWFFGRDLFDYLKYPIGELCS